MAQDLLALIVSFASPTAVELSTVIGVGGCGHCMSSNAMHWITPSFILVSWVGWRGWWVEIDKPHVTVVNWGMQFCKIIHFVEYIWGPSD